MMETMRPMPTLKGTEAREFLRRIEEGLQKPLSLKPVPKIEQAKALARERLLCK
jgi:hypothetical protein